MFISNNFKLIVFSILGLLILCNIGLAQSKVKGEPVPGAEIYIEQEPSGLKIANVTSDKNGEFTFSFPKGVKIPKSGELTLAITPAKLTAAKNTKASGLSKQKITIKFNVENGVIDAYCTADGGPYEHAYCKIETGGDKGIVKNTAFKFILIWNSPNTIKSNQGGFAVSGRNSS